MLLHRIWKDASKILVNNKTFLELGHGKIIIPHIYKANTVAIFPLNEKVAKNIEQPDEMGHPSTDVT